MGWGGGERDGKQEREGMENGERMEMNIMLNDRRVHLVNSEITKCNCTSSDHFGTFGVL